MVPLEKFVGYYKHCIIQTVVADMERKILKDLLVESEIGGQPVILGLTNRYLADADASPDDIPCNIININNIIDGKIDMNSLERRTIIGGKPGRMSLDAYALKEGDVVISTRGFPFKIAMVGRVSGLCVISSNLTAFRFQRKIIPQVIVAYFNSTEGQQELKSISRGIRYLFLNVRDILELQVPFPSSDIQTKILGYCNDVDVYLTYLKREEYLVRDIQKQVIASILEVNP